MLINIKNYNVYERFIRDVNDKLSVNSDKINHIAYLGNLTFEKNPEHMVTIHRLITAEATFHIDTDDRVKIEDMVNSKKTLLVENA